MLRIWKSSKILLRRKLKMKRTVKIEIFGRVQGINFRSMVKNFCDEKKIKGFVKNSDDGNVLIIAQALENLLDKLIEWVKQSPGFSKVENLKITTIKSEKNYKDFKIIREKPFFVDKAKALRNLSKNLL